jgi:hypothetical protein
MRQALSVTVVVAILIWLAVSMAHRHSPPPPVPPSVQNYQNCANADPGTIAPIACPAP